MHPSLGFCVENKPTSFYSYKLFLLSQGMDPITRQVGQHIEMEPEWEAAFTLQMKLTHVISMVQDWCALDVSSFMVGAVRERVGGRTLKWKQEWRKYLYSLARKLPLPPVHSIKIQKLKF